MNACMNACMECALGKISYRKSSVSHIQEPKLYIYIYMYRRIRDLGANRHLLGLRRTEINQCSKRENQLSDSEKLGQHSPLALA
jgi:hypothetical protein